MEIHTKGSEERPKKEGKWQNKGGWGSGKWGKIRSKAQIFARINGDDDRWKTKRQQSQKGKTSKQKKPMRNRKIRTEKITQI